MKSVTLCILLNESYCCVIVLYIHALSLNSKFLMTTRKNIFPAL